MSRLAARFRPAGLALAAALSLALPSAARAETLTDAFISSYLTSGLLEQNRALLRAADEDVAQAVATLRPVLSYIVQGRWQDSDSARGGDETTQSLGLSLDWTLYDFGRSALGIDLAKESVLALRAALVDIEQQVLLRGVSAFMEVRRAQAFVQLSENNVRLLGEQLRATRDRFEVGEVTRTDVALVEARLASGRSGLAGAEGDLARARAEYLTAVGRLPAALAAPPPAPAAPSSLAAAQDVALDGHPALLRAQREVAVADLGLASARASLYPRVTAGGQIANDLDGNTQSSVTLGIGGPIYSGGAINSAIRAAAARRDAARAALLLTTQEIVQNVTVAWTNLEVFSAVIVASEEEVAAARLALQGAREEFQVGEGTTIDVLDRENELLTAQTTLIDAQTNRYLAAYALRARMGLLTVEQLGLGVPTYDPALYYEAVRNAPLGTISPQGQQLDRLLEAIGRQ